MQQQPVANQPLVYENENRIAIALLHLRARDEAAEPECLAGRLLGLAAEFGDGFRWRHVRWRQHQPLLARSRSTSSSSIWLPNT